jgi:diguanylate cyclase (GGDEF)-like protein
MPGISVRRMTAAAAVAVALIGATVYLTGLIERDSALTAARRSAAAQSMLTSMLNQETGSRGFFQTRRQLFLAPWYSGANGFAAALARSRRLAGGDAELLGDLRVQARRAAAWHNAVAAEIITVQRTGLAPSDGEAIDDKDLFDSFRSATSAYETALDARRDDSLQSANWLAAGLTAALTIVLLSTAFVVARRTTVRRARRSERLRELRDLLQVSASEAESQQLLIRHVERIVPEAGAAVLTRSETEDSLVAALHEDERGGPLQGIRTDNLQRRSCMAVRLSRSYARGPDEGPLAPCDVCGQVAGEVACEPLLVGGRVIGSVLVAHAKQIRDHARSELRESVVQAAPIFATQRSLEAAEWRAASDQLTGLPNRRAADDAIRRMAAHSGRTLTPLGVVLLDLDRFKEINDRHGHDQGDKALALIGQILASAVRGSDFAARYGGEEFIVLLPDTSRAGAAEVAEKIRSAIDRAELPVVGSLTASFGVAAMPEDAVEPEQLVRKADRALYAAKARGRNRVEAPLPALMDPPPGAAPERGPLDDLS